MSDDNQLSSHEELWHFDDDEDSLDFYLLDNDEGEDEHFRREFPRTSLRVNKEQSIMMACDGLTVDVLKKGRFLSKHIGLANIKDISLGGAGLLANYFVDIGETVYIKSQDVKIKCEVCRYYPIKGALGFYGVKWLEVNGEVLNTFIERAKKHIKR